MASSDVYPEYRTNATYFQVACGIYGALGTLLLDKIPEGVYFIDELLLQTDSRYGKYLCLLHARLGRRRKPGFRRVAAGPDAVTAVTGISAPGQNP